MPKGNVAQKHKGDKNAIAIKGGSTSTQIAASKKLEDIPHKTVEKNIKKIIKKPPKAIELAKAPMQKTIPDLLFPLETQPTESYKTGMRRFGSNRDNGTRKHAGIDLYGELGTPIRAMADGKVIQISLFHKGTSAIEVDHGTFIARYTEVDSDTILVGSHDEVKRGQLIASMGKMAGLNQAMLHLEMYGTTESSEISPLTLKYKGGDRRFKRRADLIDPTESIDLSTME